MIIPTIRGGHEVNVPVAVEGAEIGDAIAIKIERIRVLSKAASSGVDKPREGAYVGDPYVAKKCPVCNEPWPEFEVVGIGEDAIRCKHCGSPPLLSEWSMDTLWYLTMILGEEYMQEMPMQCREMGKLQDIQLM
ncbi:acetamidase/formamidase family protein [Pyrococcus sp. NA2]|uniref:acetamidase/formamidase family protein n=1 Tax=Pyrococcus sp. (strain NA2) TaxID=342949 RepID=UPI00068E1784|nr:acetamidase/formamidase family protein [Pyrococcus sp. NA2]